MLCAETALCYALCSYQQVIDKTDTLTQRTTQLATEIEKRLQQKLDVRFSPLLPAFRTLLLIVFCVVLQAKVDRS